MSLLASSLPLSGRVVFAALTFILLWAGIYVSPNFADRELWPASTKSGPIVSGRQASRLTEIPIDAGASGTLLVHTGGHELVQDEADAARQWLSGLVTFD